MVIGDGDHRVEITVREVVAAPALGIGDVRAGVDVTSGPFTGSNPSLYIERAEWDRFADQLSALERTRSGEAVLQSESPNDLRLRVYATNRAGHLAVDGHVGMYRYVADTPREITLAFAFELDPSLLPRILRDVRLLQPAV
jgi:hypothetical protein